MNLLYLKPGETIPGNDDVLVLAEQNYGPGSDRAAWGIILALRKHRGGYVVWTYSRDPKYSFVLEDGHYCGKDITLAALRYQQKWRELSGTHLVRVELRIGYTVPNTDGAMAAARGAILADVLSTSYDLEPHIETIPDDGTLDEDDVPSWA